jgi:alpha-galactosidase
MVDFGSAAHGDYFSITDAYDPLSNRRAFYDASWVLPPAMLETYVQKWPTPTIENFRYMLRSGMMGWFSLMQDSNTWTPEQHAAAKREFALYKKEIRPLIRNANLYHVSDRPTAEHWDGIEYFDPISQRGVLFAFHGSSPDETSHTFTIKGLNAKTSYRISYQDQPSASYTAKGISLISSGVTVKSPTPNSSELVLIRQTASR